MRKPLLIILSLVLLCCAEEQDHSRSGYYNSFETGVYLSLGDSWEADKVLEKDRDTWPKRGDVEEVFNFYAPYSLDLTELRSYEFTEAEALSYLERGYRLATCFGGYCSPARYEYQLRFAVNILYVAY